MNRHKAKFLSKKPLGKDLFEGQTQENISKVIADNIINEDENHKMIGIEGKWGSGKSNVIELLQQKLHKAEYKFFIYDVWGHQEDLQRKSILQELITFLTQRDELGQILLKKTDYWENKLKELTGTKVETKRTTTPTLSIGISLTFILAVLLPLFETWADKTEQWKNIILLIPLFVIGLLYVIYIIIAISKIKNKGSRNWFRYIFLDSFAKIINIYKDNEIESSATEFTHETNPSVIAFNNFMMDISDTIKKDSKNKKLIIVFDNMDRLPIENVKALWSSIHTFYSEKTYPNIITIVTFDRDHIKAAFSETSDDKKGNDYINKTFDIVYRVSQPILTDWKKFLKDKWTEAFGTEESEDEYLRVEQAYDFLGQTENFTPRQIITFINEIVSIQLVLKYDIPARYIAIFVLQKDILLQNPINEIINKTYLKGLDSFYKYDENLDKYITALIYQIEPERALSVTYTNKLKHALDNNSPKELKILKEAKFLNLIIDDSLRDVSNLKNAVLALDYLSDVLSETDSNKQWNCIYQKIIDNDELNQDKDGFEPYQLILLKHLNLDTKKNYAKFLIEDNPSKNSFSILGLYHVVKQLFDFGVEKQFLKSIQNSIQIEPEEYNKLILEAKESIDLVNFYCTNEKLDAYYSALDLPSIQALKSLEWIDNRYELHNFKSTVEKHFINNRGNYPAFFDLLILLKLLSKEVLDLSRLPNDLWENLFQKANLKEKNDLAAIGLLKNHLPGQILSYLSNVTPSEEEINEFACIIEDYFTYDNVLINLEKYSKYPIYKKACQKLIKGEIKARCYANAHLLLENFDKIQIHSEISPEVLFDNISLLSFDDNCISQKALNIPILKNALKATSEFAKKCISNAKKILSEKTIEDWIEAFKNPALYGVNEALTLNFEWTSNSLEALRSFFINVATDQLPVPNDSKIYIEIVGGIKTGNTILKDVRDEFCNSGAKMTKNKFIFFADLLFQYAKLTDSSDVLRKIIPVNLISDVKCIELLNKYSSIFIKLIKNAGDEADEYKQKIIEMVIADQENPIHLIFDELKLKACTEEEK